MGSFGIKFKKHWTQCIELIKGWCNSSAYISNGMDRIIMNEPITVILPINENHQLELIAFIGLYADEGNLSRFIRKFIGIVGILKPNVMATSNKILPGMF